MRRSTDRILTTHVGALPAPDDVWAQLEVSDRTSRRGSHRSVQHADAAPASTSSTKASSPRAATGRSTLPTRLGGYEPAAERGGLGKLLMSSADWVDFDEFYLAVLQNGTLFEQSGSAPHVPEGAEDSIAFVEDWVCTGPITYRGHDGARARDRHAEERARRQAGIRRVPHHDRAAQRRARAHERASTSPTKSTSTRSPRPCGTSTRRSPQPASRCRSTTPGSARCGTASGSRWASTDTASTARCAARPSTTHCATSPRSRSGTTSAGEAGTGRTRATFRCPTSST